MGKNVKQPGLVATGKLEIWTTAQQPIILDAPAAEGYVLGRSDTNSHYLPDVDLAACDALNKGVSRRHAALVAFQGIIHIIDLNSVNGTFVNGERLPANEPYALTAGDQIQLGTLSIRLVQKNEQVSI